MIRVAAAARIMVTSVRARGFSIESSLLVIFILYGRNRFGSRGCTGGGSDPKEVDIVPIVAADGNSGFELDGPVENRPVINERMIFAVFAARINAGRKI